MGLAVRQKEARVEPAGGTIASIHSELLVSSRGELSVDRSAEGRKIPSRREKSPSHSDIRHTEVSIPFSLGGNSCNHNKLLASLPIGMVPLEARAGNTSCIIVREAPKLPAGFPFPVGLPGAGEKGLSECYRLSIVRSSSGRWEERAGGKTSSSAGRTPVRVRPERYGSSKPR